MVDGRISDARRSRRHRDLGSDPIEPDLGSVIPISPIIRITEDSPLYEEHFGLRPRPFGDPSGLVEPRLAPEPRRGPSPAPLRPRAWPGAGLLFGPPGTGKTLLARALAGELGGRSAHLTFPAMPAGRPDGLPGRRTRAPRPRPDRPGRLGPSPPGRPGRLGGAGRAPAPDRRRGPPDRRPRRPSRPSACCSTSRPPARPTWRSCWSAAPRSCSGLPPALLDRLTARCLLGPLDRSTSRPPTSSAGSRPPGPPSPLSTPLPCRAPPPGRRPPPRLNRLADLALLIAYAEGPRARPRHRPRRRPRGEPRRPGGLSRPDVPRDRGGSPRVAPSSSAPAPFNGLRIVRDSASQARARGRGLGAVDVSDSPAGRAPGFRVSTRSSLPKRACNSRFIALIFFIGSPRRLPPRGRDHPPAILLGVTTCPAAKAAFRCSRPAGSA